MPYFDCRGWLDGLVWLDWLAAELTGRDCSAFGDNALFQDPYEHLVFRVPVDVTAVLAGVDETRLQQYADDQLMDEHEIKMYRQLCALARLATTAGKSVYCWSAL
ncbi:hypothetical protein [Actinomadura rudentiformis]|uniref:Uncharacterized protein n=1 Tax=Actinomadura rudentiformis TaxID=359158 RepID=A0A6H9YFC3_9ACTN|nr:hypothetical protein [Actinomadura rudentiformis]KAB2344135.1 hypothetical protein F8566_33030 [Actinomadura rudentiformis]